ncbi:hypothetical protein [Streptomyces sp. NPDC020362]|uniref:hypothetical protein n=1 Tax=unclassified Streptomyces TaxID=2593676 RepID=UPI0033D83B50
MHGAEAEPGEIEGEKLLVGLLGQAGVQHDAEAAVRVLEDQRAGRFLAGPAQGPDGFLGAAAGVVGGLLGERLQEGVQGDGDQEPIARRVLVTGPGPVGRGVNSPK